MLIQMHFTYTCSSCNAPRGDPNPASCAIARRSRREQIFIGNSLKATKTIKTHLIWYINLIQTNYIWYFTFLNFSYFWTSINLTMGQSCSKRNLDMNTDLKSSYFTLKCNLRDLLISSYFLFKSDFKVAENISASNLENQPFGP